MRPHTVIAGILAVSALMMGPSLTMSAQTSWESLQGLIVSIVGLIFAVLFSCSWAASMADRGAPKRRSRQQ